MKAIIKQTIFFVALFAAASISAAKGDTLSGTVLDGEGRPVEFASVAVWQDSLQRGGAIADSTGYFHMSLPRGAYRATASFVGHETSEQTVFVDGDTRIKFVLDMDGVLMDGVEVRASAIRREADRFVMIVEDMPATIGKSGKELLQDAPGVWIDDDKISINGKGGTKIYVNERELRMGNDQLQSFLKALKAEDVSRVEVIPQTGAEYSADATGGIIKIVMKKNRADGIMGNVGMSGNFGKYQSALNPSAALNVKKGKWTFNLNGNASYYPNQQRYMDERNDYANESAYATRTSMDADNMVAGNVLAGVFFDPNAFNSLGLEVSYSHSKVPCLTTTDAVFDRLFYEEKIAGSYDSRSRDIYFDATFNYVHRMDSLGSSLKTIASYTRSNGRQTADNEMHVRVPAFPELPALSSDSLSRSEERSVYDVANVSFDFDKKFNSKWSVSAGAKYTLNLMNNDADYVHLKDLQWHPVESRNYDERYTENIYALYAKASARFGRLSLVAGLRGELTDAESRGKIVEQHYFDLFPSGFLSYAFDEASAHSLTFGYARNIGRPSFWSLNPVRDQSSDYFYQAGNPNLKPTYTNNFWLTGVVKYRYSLTFWATLYKDAMMQGSLPDVQNPDNVLFSTINADRQEMYGATLSLPFQFVKWWTLNANVSYIYKGDRLLATDPMRWCHCVNLSANTGFTLPRDFYFNVTYFFQNQVSQGEMTIGALHFLSASLKKTFSGGRWTASLSANNLLKAAMNLTIDTSAYRSVTNVEIPASFGVSLTYNFNVGEMFRTKQIEKNVDASRFTKSDPAGK